MPASDDVILKVNGALYSGWQEIAIKRSLKAISGSFDLSVADRWTEQQAAWLIVPGDACQVFIGSDQLIEGYVDRVSPSFDPNNRSIAVRGRDSSCDLVDCSVPLLPVVWNNVTLPYLANLLCSKFDIGVTVDPSAAKAASKVFYSAKAQPGESIFEFLEKYARLAAVLLTNDGKGNIVITLAGQNRASNDLVQGQNIKAAAADYDNSERFSNYTVVAQNSTITGDDPGTAFSCKGSASDSQIDRYRPKVIQSEAAAGSADCTLRAQWEMKVRAARSAKGSVTVQGWRQKNNQLWQLNQIVRVNSNWLGINLDTLITDLAFKKGADGTTTEIGYERPDAYTPDPTLVDKNDALLQISAREQAR